MVFLAEACKPMTEALLAYNSVALDEVGTIGDTEDRTLVLAERAELDGRQLAKQKGAVPK